MPDHGERNRRDCGSAALSGALTLLAGGILAASFVLTPERLPGFGICAIRRWTGLPCPGCGLTRAFCAISRGNIAGAIALNPFSLPLYAATILLLLRPLLNRWRPELEPRVVASRWFVRGPLLLVAAMWLFGLVRILAALGVGNGVPTF